MDKLLFIQRRRNLGWMTPDEARRRLANGEIEPDAFWTKSVRSNKPGRTADSYSIAELVKYGDFESLSWDSPFQRRHYLLAELDFPRLKTLGAAVAEGEVCLSLLSGYISSAYRRLTPPYCVPETELGEAKCRDLAQHAIATSPRRFSLQPNGLQLTIHAEFVDDLLVEKAAIEIVNELQFDEPAYFNYVRSRVISIRPSEEVQEDEDYGSQSAWNRHIGI